MATSELDTRLADWAAAVTNPGNGMLKGLKALDRTTIDSLRRKDATDFLRPSLVARAALSRAHPHSGIRGLPSDSLQIDRVRRRDAALCTFFQEVDAICTRLFPADSRADVSFLSTDSHNGGRRPLRIDTTTGSFVLKFAEPQAYRILSEIAGHAEAATGVALAMPPIHADSIGEGWYLLPYLHESHGADVRRFMTAAGGITALALVLGIVDAHLENVIVWDGRPVIIDPECIFYFTGGIPAADRLVSTGLLSHNLHLSALRGASVPMVTLAQSLGADGVLRYSRPATGLRHRLRDGTGALIDPADHWTAVLEGFERVYAFVRNERTSLTQLIQSHMDEGFRVRCLLRKTRHYTTVLEMLNLPQTDDGRAHRAAVFARFRQAGAFEEMTEAMVQAETDDLLNGDVPYFWFRAGDGAIHHRNGIVHPNRLARPIQDSIPSMFEDMGAEDAALQTAILRQFLEAPL